MCWLYCCRKPPPKPGNLGIPKLIGVVTIMGLKYTIGLPIPGAPDVATREVSLTVDAQPAVVSQLPGTAMEFVFTVEKDKAISLFLVDVDGSGNRSVPSATLAFSSTDTIPPPKPGDLTVTNVEEV